MTMSDDDRDVDMATPEPITPPPILTPGPKQISQILVFDGQKRRLVLKKKHNEYTMDIVRAKITKKFKVKGLIANTPFTITLINSGQIIQMDEDIVKYLPEYKGDAQITQ